MDSIRTDDLSIPFGYRQHVKKTNRAELQPQNQNLETLPTSKKYIGNKILNDVPNTKEAVLNEEPAALSLKGLEKKGSTRRDKNGNDGGKDKKNSIEGQDVKPSASLPGKNTYNSYNTFNPGQFEESSAEWQMAMLHYLLDMKKNGHKVREVSVDKVKLKVSKIFLARLIILQNPKSCILEVLTNIFHFSRCSICIGSLRNKIPKMIVK